MVEVKLKILELWCDSESKNNDMIKAIDLLKKVGESLPIEVTFVDARTKTEDERKRFYDKLVDTLVRPGYAISYPLRGAQKDYDFGIKRPMLVVYDTNRIVDIYPHREKVKTSTTIKNRTIEGKVKKIISIQEYLRLIMK